jgi:hypothetical protein
MKIIRHSRIPITLASSDKLTPDLLKAITLDLEWYGWDRWIDEYGNWFEHSKPNRNQMELFK